MGTEQKEGSPRNCDGERAAVNMISANSSNYENLWGNLVFSEASEKDFDKIFTALRGLIKEANSPDNELELVKRLSSELIKRTDKSSTRLQILSDMFHLLSFGESQFLVCEKFLEVAGREVIADHLKIFGKIDSITKNCDTSFVDKREMFLSISNLLGASQSSAVDSHNFLIKYLATISIEDADILEKSKEKSVRAILDVVKLPNLFECPWYELPAVKQLENDIEFDVVHQLLKIFVTQELDTYLEFYDENSEVLEKHGLVQADHTHCVNKMRLFSLVQLCDLPNPRFNEIEYSLITETLQIDESEVEKWVNMAQSANLLSCDINKGAKTITVSSCIERSSDISRWPSIRLKGINWVEKNPELGKEVTHQGNIACHSNACAKAVGNLYFHENGKPDIWKAARQELIDRVIKAYPGIKKQRGFYQHKSTSTYPLAYTKCLEYIITHGIGLEQNYPYTVKRNVKKSFPPSKDEYPRLYIEGYEWLGCVKDGKKSMVKVCKGLFKNALIGNIYLTSKLLNLNCETYDETVVEDLLAEKAELKNLLMSKPEGSGVVHTVLLVALDIIKKKILILNSFGPEWGKYGLAWVDWDILFDISRVYSSSIVKKFPSAPTVNTVECCIDADVASGNSRPGPADCKGSSENERN